MKNLKPFTLTLAAAAMLSLTGAQAVSAGLIPLTLTNPGFETGDGTGWDLDNFTVVSTDPNTGSFHITAGSFNGGTTNGFAFASQNIDITAYATDIDTGNMTTDIKFFVKRTDNFDLHAAEVEFFDNSSSSLGTVTNATAGPGSTGWVQETIGDGEVSVPVGTRSMTVTLIGDIGSAGSSINVLFDDASASLFIPEPASLALLSIGGLLIAGRRRRN